MNKSPRAAVKMVIKLLRLEKIILIISRCFVLLRNSSAGIAESPSTPMMKIDATKRSLFRL
jgi:hypothetical protein